MSMGQPRPEEGGSVPAAVVRRPHGWGRQGGWRVANRQPGGNMSALLGVGPEVVERISGTTIMDGIAVEVSAPSSNRRLRRRAAGEPAR